MSYYGVIQRRVSAAEERLSAFLVHVPVPVPVPGFDRATHGQRRADRPSRQNQGKSMARFSP